MPIQPAKRPAPSSERAFALALRQGDTRTAHKIALDATRRRPREARGWQWLGTTELKLGNHQEALTALSRSQQFAPDDSQTAYLLGKLHQEEKRWEQAKDWLERALQGHPGHSHGHARLAQVYLALGAPKKAIAHIDQAVEQAPDNHVFLSQRVAIDFSARRMEHSLADCERLLQLAPERADYLRLAATLHSYFGRFEEAERLNRKAMQLEPAHLMTASSRLFNAHYDPSLSGDDIATMIEQWRALFSVNRGAGRPPVTSRDRARPLVIGLLSAGLRSHPVGNMITAALEQLPADQYRLVGYSGKDREDRISHRLKTICSLWHQVNGLGDEALEALIRQDQVDILIDMNGHTDGNRLAVVANEPAPLIVKWVGGLVNTTGLDAIDYLISDAVETPPGSDDAYLEKLIRMPHDYICYEPPAHAPDVGPLPALTNGHITFGCLNNPAKLNRRIIARWAELMEAVPNSRLLLKGVQFDDRGFRERILALFAEHGIAARRLGLEGPEKHTAFLNTYNRIDIALDPWPYSGGLTTCEALLMGVPVITLPGPTFAGRHAASHLVNAGLPELVVEDWNQYRRRALELAGDLDSLATIRARLRDTLTASPVCDAPSFSLSLATALRGIWQRHCEGLAPAALNFEAPGRARFEDGRADPLPPPPGAPTLVQAARRRDDPAVDFEFDLDGRLVVIDNGATLLNDGTGATLQRLGAFELLLFDPAGKHAEHPPQGDGVQYFPGAVLGDGATVTFRACLDPALSATLAPLDDAGPGARVLAELPMPSVALDRVEGLPGLDWLLLDEHHDSLGILRHGRETLRDALVIQVGIAFRATHQDQPTLEGLCAWAADNGFQLYRLDRLDHHSHLPEALGDQRQATELRRADALLVPSARRRRDLSPQRRQRLAFLLHTVYGIHDLSHALLNATDPDQASRYLAAMTPAATPPAVDGPPTIPDAPHMSDSERALFKDCLHNARRYFEFGGGGSTVWAAASGLTVFGVESDQQWVEGLRRRLGDRCRVSAVDIGPTGDWGVPLDRRRQEHFYLYSDAIHQHPHGFDLILVDGRFRVACTLSAILHTLEHADVPGDTRLFIHDFWNRPHYHTVLEFLDTEASADSAGVFRLKADLDRGQLTETLARYRNVPD